MQKAKHTLERAENAVSQQNANNHNLGRFARLRTLAAAQDLVIVLHEEQMQGDTWEPTMAHLYKVNDHSGINGYIGQPIATIMRKDADAESFVAIAAGVLEITTAGDADKAEPKG